ncbi:MAG: hypothetical protein R3C45_15600 [Phycisphaerales bacterium]
MPIKHATSSSPRASPSSSRLQAGRYRPEEQRPAATHRRRRRSAPLTLREKQQIDSELETIRTA